MNNNEILKGKRVLLVDDEPEVLESIKELLDMCLVETAINFETATNLLSEKDFDVAVLDIMGVRGYSLLEIANQKGLPAVMLTAHALSPDSFVKSIQKGAQAYIPKEKMTDIAIFLSDLLEAHQNNRKYGGWFGKLKKFFDSKFGTGWIKRYQEFKEQYPEYMDDDYK